MMLDIARGLEYLHLRKPSVIHRDCKSSNILITSRGTAKIADFGLAKVKQSTRSMVRSLVGTVNWQAPELWHAHPKYNHKVDVFSCAMVYWEMLQWHITNKKFPWEVSSFGLRHGWAILLTAYVGHERACHLRYRGGKATTVCTLNFVFDRILIYIFCRPSISGLRKAWCAEIVDLIERMWAQEHQDRPTMSEVVEELEQMVQR
jgi:serine/threonine protein kinase